MTADSKLFKAFGPSRPTPPPVQAQLDHMAAVINTLAHTLGEMDLRLLFTMRQIRMGRVKPGALVDPMTGKLPVQHTTLAQLFDEQRDVFVQALMQEMEAVRDENAHSQPVSADHGDGAGASEGGAAVQGNGHDPDPPSFRGSGVIHDINES